MRQTCTLGSSYQQKCKIQNKSRQLSVIKVGVFNIEMKRFNEIETFKPCIQVWWYSIMTFRELIKVTWYSQRTSQSSKPIITILSPRYILFQSLILGSKSLEFTFNNNHMEPLSYFALMVSGVDPSVVLGSVQIKQEVEESFRRDRIWNKTAPNWAMYWIICPMHRKE